MHGLHGASSVEDLFQLSFNGKSESLSNNQYNCQPSLMELIVGEESQVRLSAKRAKISICTCQISKAKARTHRVMQNNNGLVEVPEPVW